MHGHYKTVAAAVCVNEVGIQKSIVLTEQTSSRHSTQHVILLFLPSVRVTVVNIKIV